MKSLFRYFAGNHILANVMAIIIIVLGTMAFIGINRDINPKVDFGKMRIDTIYPGASSRDVELNVTNKIEKELEGVTGIKKYTSVSMENQSSIKIEIDSSVSNMEDVKRDIRRAVDQVNDLPQEVDKAPLITEIKSSIFPVVEVGISSDKISYKDLRDIAKSFEKKLKSIRGVSRLDRFNYNAREIKIEVSPESMDHYGISLTEIMQAIKMRNIRASGGQFESYLNGKNIVTLSQFENPMEVGDVIVKSNFEGLLIKVKDLAIYKDDFKKPTVISKMNGKQAISFVVFKSDYADIVTVVDEVRALVKDEQKYLPKDIDFIFSNDVSKKVKNRFDIVGSNGIIGLILVLIILTLFLNFKSAFWVAMGIPLTIFGVVFTMNFMGLSLDALSLAAMIIVIGIIVDDAIIITENIYRHKQELNKDPITAAVDGLSEVFWPVLTTILTTFFAFAPMFFMKGVMGKFIYVIPFVISLALFISLFEATLILPAHIVTGVKKLKDQASGGDDWFLKIRNPFIRILKKILKHRYLCISFFVISLISSLFYCVNYMDFILFPSSTAERFFVNVEMERGISIDANLERLKKIENIVKKLPSTELDSYVTRAGLNAYDHHGKKEGINLGTVEVNLLPFGKRKRAANFIVEELRPKIEKLKGFKSLTFVIAEGGPPVGNPVTVGIVGADDKKRGELATKVLSFLKTVPGTKDLEKDDKEGRDQLNIVIDYEKLSILGLNVSSVAQTVRAAYDGQVITSLRQGDEDIDFRVLLKKESREKENNIGELLVANNRGKLIPLKNIAKFKIRSGRQDIKHFNGDRSITITGEVDKAVTTPTKVANKLKSDFNLSKDWRGMNFIVGGEAQETEQSLKSLIFTFSVAFFLIYFLLILLFKSFFQPLYVMSAIPFGLMGIIISFALHNEPLGFLAILGVVGLIGVVVNDSLVLVDHLNQMRKEKPDMDFLELVSIGTGDRLRAITVTTITTVAGLLPLAYGIGGADPFMMPMALALGYGLIFATPLTLVFVPCLILIGEDISDLIKSKNKRGKFNFMSGDCEDNKTLSLEG